MLIGIDLAFQIQILAKTNLLTETTPLLDLTSRKGKNGLIVELVGYCIFLNLELRIPISAIFTHEIFLPDLTSKNGAL